MTTNKHGLKLGLCDVDRVYLFVGEKDDAVEGNCLWYQFVDDRVIPVYNKTLLGHLKGLTVRIKQHKGKDNPKLDIDIMADRPYTIRTGINTIFGRKFLLAVRSLQNYDEPIYISVSKGDEDKVVFCHVLRSDRSYIKIEWDKDIKLFPIVQEIQKRLGQEVQTADSLKLK